MQKSIANAKQQIFLKLIRKFRQRAGLRQVDVAKRLDQPQSFVSKYESGERRLDLLELEQVCEACDTDLVNFVRKYQALV